MNIVIHCGSGGPPEWGPESINRGIGGSEEAVIYLSRELAKFGHSVTIFNNIDPARMGDYDGVRWINVHAQPEANYRPHDIFIAWRDWRLFSLAHPSAKRYLWEQDQAASVHWAPEAVSVFDRVVLGNEHHAALYEAAGCPREQMFVVTNGVDLRQFDQFQVKLGGVETEEEFFAEKDPLEIPRVRIERIPGKCIYFSHPGRGLHRLREYWPKIRAAVPHATLHAFWWEEQFLKDYPANEALGIMPMRALGHMELAREILSSDLFTYPSVFDPEVGGIVCLKAQAGGAWPVVVPKGGMMDYLQFASVGTQEDFANRVIGTLQAGVSDGARTEMMHSAHERYGWPGIALRWQEEFEKELAKCECNRDDAGLRTIEDGAYQNETN